VWKFSDAEKVVYNDLPAGDQVLDEICAPEEVIHDPRISSEHVGTAGARLNVAAVLDHIKVGDYLLRAERDRILFDAAGEKSQFIAIVALTEQREFKKVSRNVRPPMGWVADRIALDAPNLSAMTCGDHVSTQRRGGQKTHARIRNDLSRSLVANLRRRVFFFSQST
jgi:hypothetical protein